MLAFPVSHNFSVYTQSVKSWLKLLLTISVSTSWTIHFISCFAALSGAVYMASVMRNSVNKAVREEVITPVSISSPSTQHLVAC